jgi:uncharacterized protein (DUF934 family)
VPAKVIAAARVRDGAAVWRGPGDQWVDRIDAACLFDESSVVTALAQAAAPGRLPVIDVREVAVERRDGRGFTLARMLRTRYRFERDIRAVGHLLPDQLDALRLCGFSSVRSADEHPPEQWAPASGEGAPILREGVSTARSALPLLNRLVSRRFS